ncbi:hypothetical protein PQI07_31190 [Methylobacterium sp. 092160098-2]|uniref:hypothetical protein n=1 Tax=Methylobacterium sp. 092160098-2 TaxID=3025129 RepID=UPI002381AC37|nr:hypothetical protein [Methylobacterium sp. 092160098-2]MDE4915104.1 hypothetical protein [Methylobacterium sp. 092160098-2]
MTRLSGYKPPEERPERGLPRWLVFVIATLAFSTPIAGLFLMIWPVLLRRTSLVADGIELIFLAVATVLIGGAIASYIHRDRGQRL